MKHNKSAAVLYMLVVTTVGSNNMLSQSSKSREKVVRTVPQYTTCLYYIFTKLFFLRVLWDLLRPVTGQTVLLPAVLPGVSCELILPRKFGCFSSLSHFSLLPFFVESVFEERGYLHERVVHNKCGQVWLEWPSQWETRLVAYNVFHSVVKK